MAPSKLSLFLPLLLITVGVGWLLTTLGIAPHIDWIWILGLAVAGVLAFAFGGFNKVSVVVGPFFLAASFLSLLRQTERMSIDMGGAALGDPVGHLAIGGPAAQCALAAVGESGDTKTRVNSKMHGGIAFGNTSAI